MIGQYLSQTNESATVPILQKFLELNKALMSRSGSIEPTVQRENPRFNLALTNLQTK